MNSNIPSPSAIALADELRSVLERINAYAGPEAARAILAEDIDAARQVVADVDHITGTAATFMRESGMDPEWYGQAKDGLHHTVGALCDVYALDEFLEDNDPARLARMAELDATWSAAHVDPRVLDAVRAEMDARAHRLAIEKEAALQGMAARWAERYAGRAS